MKLYLNPYPPSPSVERGHRNTSPDDVVIQIRLIRHLLRPLLPDFAVFGCKLLRRLLHFLVQSLGHNTRGMGLSEMQAQGTGEWRPQGPAMAVRGRTCLIHLGPPAPSSQFDAKMVTAFEPLLVRLRTALNWVTWGENTNGGSAPQKGPGEHAHVCFRQYWHHGFWRWTSLSVVCSSNGVAVH